MPIEFEIALRNLEAHPKDGRQPGGIVATFQVTQPGQSVDSRLPRSFELPVTLGGGYFADKDVVEVTQARLALIAEALVAATADWKRDEDWFKARRVDGEQP